MRVLEYSFYLNRTNYYCRKSRDKFRNLPQTTIRNPIWVSCIDCLPDSKPVNSNHFLISLIVNKILLFLTVPTPLHNA